MTELTKARSSAAAANSLAGDPLSGGGTDEEAAGGIANMRVVNAAKVIFLGSLVQNTIFTVDRLKHQHAIVSTFTQDCFEYGKAPERCLSFVLLQGKG